MADTAEKQAKKQAKKRAIKYLHEAMELRPNATEAQLRRELRKRLHADGYRLGWGVIIKIILSLLPLFFQKPKP